MFHTRSAIHTRRVHLSIRGAAEAAVEREGSGGLPRVASTPVRQNYIDAVLFSGLKWDPAIQTLLWANFYYIVTQQHLCQLVIGNEACVAKSHIDV